MCWPLYDKKDISDCRNEGTDTCRVTVWSSDNAENVGATTTRTFGISSPAPACNSADYTTCPGYYMLSGEMIKTEGL